MPNNQLRPAAKIPYLKSRQDAPQLRFMVQNNGFSMNIFQEFHQLFGLLQIDIRENLVQEYKIIVFEGQMHQINDQPLPHGPRGKLCAIAVFVPNHQRVVQEEPANIDQMRVVFGGELARRGFQQLFSVKVRNSRPPHSACKFADSGQFPRGEDLV